MGIAFELTDEQRQMLDSLSRVRRTVIGPNAQHSPWRRYPRAAT